MKAKELKKILEGANDEMDVFISDVDGSCLQVIGCSVSNDHECVYLDTRQEFPDTWFRDGAEVRWVGDGIIPADPNETEEIFMTDPDIFGNADEVCLKLDFHDGYADSKEYPGLRVNYPKLDEISDDDLYELDKYVGGRLSDSGCYTPYDIAIKYGKLEYFGIMDTGNCHDEALVKEINLKWLKFKRFFRPILVALYTRDIDEITDHDAFKISEWLEWPEYSEGCDTDDWKPYNKRCLDDMVLNWDSFADNYLMHIADDQDLETILTFVRYDVCEDYS